MNWRCLRCKVVFSGEKIRDRGCPCPCDCLKLGFPSPSPWEPAWGSSLLSNFQREVHEWAQATFPSQTPQSKLNHLDDEIQELMENPSDPMELADCFILLLSISEMAGVDLLSAAEEKFEINKNRKWGKPDERGVVKHIEES